MDSRTRRKLWTVLRWAAYTFLILFLYILSETPGFLQIGRIKPVLLIPCAVFLSIYEGEFAGGLCGVFCGLLMDLGGGRAIGFFAFFMLIFCVVAGLAFIYLVKLSMLTSTLAVLAVTAAVELIDYFFSYVIWGFEENFVIFIQTVLPVIFYTTVLAPIFYLIIRRMHAFFDRKLTADS